MALFSGAEQICCNCGNWRGVREWAKTAKAWFSLNEVSGRCLHHGTPQFPDDACPRWSPRNMDTAPHTPHA